MKRNAPANVKDLGKKLFSYAAISDTHVNHGERETNSVYPVNALHNGRFRHVVRELNQNADIEFVIHMGDLVHPVPAIPDLFKAACECFKDIASELKCPMHVMPGNHDVGDKLNNWTPAICVADEYLQAFCEQFGEDYHAFEHKGVHFILLNTQLINSGLDAEAEQSSWLEGYFEQHKGQRFVFHSHYPVYLGLRDEGSHYDNVDEPGRTWLLNLLEKYQVELLFTAHAHTFWYHRFAGADVYAMPSTACIRQDYSEILRTPPDPDMEGGRNDQPKHGYLLVDIYERGHLCHMIRTYGAVVDPDVPHAKAVERVRQVHPLENQRVRLGFDMRQDWMEFVQIPPSGGPDEFNRKAARNDYPLLSLWEMGARRLRIPRIDLTEPARRERLRALLGHGHEFVLYTFELPDPAFLEILTENADLLAGLEVICRWSDLDKVAGQIAPVRAKTGIPVYLSVLRGKEEQDNSSGKYVHALNHGFLPSEKAKVTEAADNPHVDGLVFRLGGADPVWENVTAAAAICADLGVESSINLRMSSVNPAEFVKDELWAANRIAEAVLASSVQTRPNVIADTLADFDRGFFRRYGMIDRLCNPRLGFHVVRHFNGAINMNLDTFSDFEVAESDAGRTIRMTGGNKVADLILPNQGARLKDLISEGDGGKIKSCLNLATGIISDDTPALPDAPVIVLY
ncbi:MAG: metallophosphoesterase [Parvularculales bacterium]